jgi:hypothetical protein
MNPRRTRLSVLALCAGLCGCHTPDITATAPPAFDRAAEDRELKTLAAHTDDTRGLQKLESDVIVHSGQRAIRKKDSLVLALLAGAPVALTTQHNCAHPTAESCVSYALVADLPSRHAYVVARNYFEGGDFLMIDDRTGKRVPLDGALFFSPDDQMFATVCNDVEFDCADVEIWDRTADGAVSVFKHRKSGDYEIAFVDWTQGGIELELRSYAEAGRPARRWKALLHRTGSTWRFEEIKPPH